MGRVGSCFDNAAVESFFSTLEHEVLSRHHFTTRKEAREVVVTWLVDFYNGS
jgi:transposase InsO family protein